MAKPGAESETADLVGQLLDGRFRIETRIGSGASGVVYQALQMPLERPVAIKTLSQGLEDTLEWVRRFRREAKVLSQLHHPNSVRLIDFGHTDTGLVYLVMELLQGHDLFRHLQRHGRLQLGVAIDIARQALGALHEAHDKGIIHRDLKPSNVYLCRTEWSDHHVKIIDYGLAKGGGGIKGDSLTGTGMLVGTPQYMAPEQCLGQGVTHATDLYAIGCIFFEMITGRPPYVSPKPMELLTKHVNARIPNIATFVNDLADTAAVQQAIDRLMAKSPDQRPTSAREAIELLDRLEGGAAASAVMFGSTAAHAASGTYRAESAEAQEATALEIQAMPDDDPPPRGPESEALLEMGAAAAQRPAGLSQMIRRGRPRSQAFAETALGVANLTLPTDSLDAEGRRTDELDVLGADDLVVEPEEAPDEGPRSTRGRRRRTPVERRPLPPPVARTLGDVPWTPPAPPGAAPPSSAPPSSAPPSSAPPTSAPPAPAPPASAPPSPTPPSPPPAARRRPSRSSAKGRRMPRRSVPVADLWARLRVELHFPSGGAPTGLSAELYDEPGARPRPLRWRQSGEVWLTQTAINRPTLQGAAIRVELEAPDGVPFLLRVWSSRPKPHVMLEEQGQGRGRLATFELALRD